MNKRKRLYRILSAEGVKEIGHIFKAGVPVMQMIPVLAQLEGRDGSEFVFLVDWERLSENEKARVLEYMTAKFEAESSEIREFIASAGYFPIRVV